MAIVTRAAKVAAPAVRRIRRRVPAALRGRSGVVLAYHDVLPDSAGAYPYAVRRSTFLRQLDVAGVAGLRFVTLTEFTDALLSGDACGLAAVVFDDALSGVHRHALPALHERRIPWTLLPVTDRTGMAPEWWPEAERTMTLTEIREALDAGATLCSHTATHRSLPELPPAVALDELRRSRDTVSEWAGTEIREICYPFGHQDAQVRALTAEAGYRCGYTFTNGRSHPATDPFAQPRLAMREGIPSHRWALTLLRPHRSWPPVRDLRDEFLRGGGTS